MGDLVVELIIVLFLGSIVGHAFFSTWFNFLKMLRYYSILKKIMQGQIKVQVDNKKQKTTEAEVETVDIDVIKEIMAYFKKR